MNKTIKYSMKLSICVLLISSFYNTVVSQNITNTLGTLGIFRIKDNSTTFLSMDQSTGVLSLNRNMNLLNSTSISTGVIMKNSTPFIHDFTGAGTDGNNTFIGVNSGNFSMGGAVNTYGSYNTALGKNTMIRNTTGSYNTSIGYLTLNQNTTGLLNTAVGTYSMNLNVTGSFNTSLGVSTLYNNTTGNKNVAIGTYALFSNTTGFDNVAIGYNSQNSVVSFAQNTSVGNNTLTNNLSSSNSAFGFGSMENNTGGIQNSAFGTGSLRNNINGNENSCFGIISLSDNVSGNYNSAFGSRSLSSNVSGSFNAAFGNSSAQNFTSGIKNSFFGYTSGDNLQTGDNNIAIGHNSLFPSANISNCIRLGNTSITYASLQVAWTITSDRNLKHDIINLPLGLQFINRLRPVSYIRNNDESGKNEFGLIAQEVEEALIEAGADYSGMVTVTDIGEYQLRYNDLLAPMIKAIQELKEKCDRLEKENSVLSTELSRFEVLRSEFEELKGLYYKISCKFIDRGEDIRLTEGNSEINR